MRIHRNAKTTPAARAALVHRVLHEDWTYAETATAFAVSERTVAKWVHRFRVGGAAALEDASSRPGPAPHLTPARGVTEIRQLRVAQGLPAWAIARTLGRPRSTVSAWLRRRGISRPPTCSTSTSSHWPEFAPSGIGSMGTADGPRGAPAGSTSMSRSMIPVGLPTSRSSPTNGATRARRFSSAVWPGWPRARTWSAA